MKHEPGPASTGLRPWLERALQVGVRPFANAKDAQQALSDLSEDGESRAADASRTLLAFRAPDVPASAAPAAKAPPGTMAVAGRRARKPETQGRAGGRVFRATAHAPVRREGVGPCRRQCAGARRSRRHHRVALRPPRSGHRPRGIAFRRDDRPGARHAEANGWSIAPAPPTAGVPSPPRVTRPVKPSPAAPVAAEPPPAERPVPAGPRIGGVRVRRRSNCRSSKPAGSSARRQDRSRSTRARTISKS